MQTRLLPNGLLCPIAVLLLACSSPVDRVNSMDSGDAAEGTRSASVIEGQNTTGSSQAAHIFVSAFLERYMPLTNFPDEGPAYWVIINDSTAWLSPQLASALRADSAAAASPSPTREPLNFDVFLGSNDPCESYQVKSASPDGSQFEVLVQPGCPYRQSDGQLRFIVGWVAGSPAIANVLYHSSNLVAELCRAEREDRSNHAVSALCGTEKGSR